ncbi:MAG TPA: glycosyltransferase family 4 protein [Candidatus Polarisedimenticolia bacterium]|nr:glycosyltransferase family 4 protein [Candidatus Polarisedimenticolia bacterium]
MKTRVCHIITKLELGGAQQNTLYTVAHLDRTRFEPSLVTGPGGLLTQEARSSGVTLHVLPSLRREVSPPGDLKALADLVRLLRRERPHIVHTHSSKAGILGRWAATLAGVPHIVHSVHGYGFHDGQNAVARTLFVSAERATGRLATSAFIAVSRANIDRGLDLELFPPDRVCLVRSGVPLAEFSPRPPVTTSGGPVTVGMVACLKPQKAPLDFIRVAARVALETAAGPTIRFILVGDGEMRPEVEALIRAERLEDRVTLAGWRRDIPALMRRFDILLHTSLWEGLPRVFPEAMATALPIVATRVDGAPEAIEEGITGFLLPPGDVEGLARRTLELALDPALRRRMGEAAVSRVEPWDIDQMVRRQERLYEALIAQGPAAAAAQLAGSATR